MFSRKTTQALEKFEITKSIRCEVVSMTAYEIWRHTQVLRSDEYNTVCSAVVNAYPVLKDTIGTPYVSEEMCVSL